MPDVSSLYPAPPQQSQQGQGLLTGNPLQAIDALSRLQDYRIRQQQAPALGQQPGATLQSTQAGIANTQAGTTNTVAQTQRVMLELQTAKMQQEQAARRQYGSYIANSVLGNPNPSEDDVHNAIANAATTYPDIAKQFPQIPQAITSVMTRGKDYAKNARTLQATIQTPEEAAQRVAGPISPSGAPTTQSLVEATGRGPTQTGLEPGQEESAKQFAAEKFAAADYRNRAVSLEQIIPLLRELGPQGTGFGAEFKRKLAQMGTTVGLDDSDAVVRDKLHKYLLRQATTSGDTATNDKLWANIRSNPNEELTEGANIDLARMNLAQMRLKQAQVLEAQAPTPTMANPSPKPTPPISYSDFAPKFNTAQDERAYVMDHYSPQERSKILDEVDKQRSSKNPQERAKAQRFLDSYRIARSQPGLLDLSRLGQ